MAHSPTQLHSPVDNPTRPRGILKNTTSYQGQSTSPNAIYSPSDSAAPASSSLEADPISLEAARRPSLPHQASEKELTHQNTLANAGPRRNSSNPRSSMSESRRQSTNAMDVDENENEPRLKWDEANLYLAEQDRGNTMRIDEPKTPYAKQYDPAEDEEEIAAINAQDLVVDELDKAKASGSISTKPKKESIPDLDLGEPEEPVDKTDSGEKRVIVEDSPEDSSKGHGEEPIESMSAEERRKHRQFEERRKRHYDMKDVKGVLGHSEDIDGADEDENGAPPMPR
ncbi:MAG: hypothetical protein M1828_002039 [Chrysothrix sp. TS-e1954]|nr:MAG: hypothetical protein M1828_002039 [Chrysothrix sp. TS-e1954]